MKRHQTGLSGHVMKLEPMEEEPDIHIHSPSIPAHLIRRYTHRHISGLVVEVEMNST
jgi:hypothetical protein